MSKNCLNALSSFRKVRSTYPESSKDYCREATLAFGSLREFNELDSRLRGNDGLEISAFAGEHMDVREKVVCPG